LVYVKPTSDIFIKYLFGKEEHKPLLLDFINAVQKSCDFPLIMDLEIKNPFNIKTIAAEKESILDIKAIAENGKTYNIEVQTSGKGVYKHRSLYYWSKLYAAQLMTGDQYKKLYPVSCINILDFELFNLKGKYHLCFVPRELRDPSLILTDHLALHFLELPQFTTANMDMTLDKWLYYLKHEGSDEEDTTMKTLLEDNPRLAEAHEKYSAFTRDEELRDIYEARMKWQLDYNSGMDAARQEGLEKGLEKGLEEGRQAVIQRQLAKRFGRNALAPQFEERLSKATSEQLDLWAEKLLDAKSVDEVFRDN
jgi:predicted transposase/invertase (TIGR01784 family)